MVDILVNPKPYLIPIEMIMSIKQRPLQQMNLTLHRGQWRVCLRQIVLEESLSSNLFEGSMSTLGEHSHKVSLVPLHVGGVGRLSN